MSFAKDVRTTCVLKRKPAACIQRQSWTPISSDCKACEFRGRKAPGGEQEPALREQERGIREQEMTSDETTVTRMEGGVSNETLRNAILRVLGRKGEMNISTLKNFSGQYVSQEEFQKTIDELSISGRIMKKAGIREGSFKVCLPGTSGSPPSNAARKPEPSKADGDPRPPALRKPRAKPLSATGKKVVDNKLPADGAYAEVIKDLEAKRQNIDNVIATLRELG